MSDFACIGAEEVQAQYQLWGLLQAHHLQATLSQSAWQERGPRGRTAARGGGVRVVAGSFPALGCQLFPCLSPPGVAQPWAHVDTYLYVTLGRVPFSHRELQWFIIRMINLSDKIPILGVSSLMGCRDGVGTQNCPLGLQVVVWVRTWLSWP